MLTFPADYHPMDAAQIQILRSGQKWFHTQATNRERCIAQSINPPVVLRGLHCSHSPHGWRRVFDPVSREESAEVLRPFCQQQFVKMLASLKTRPQVRTNRRQLRILFHDVAPRSNKDALITPVRFSFPIPLFKLMPVGFNRSATRSIFTPFDKLATMGIFLCIAVVASRTNFCTSGPRIKSRVSPTDLRRFAHLFIPSGNPVVLLGPVLVVRYCRLR